MRACSCFATVIVASRIDARDDVQRLARAERLALLVLLAGASATAGAPGAGTLPAAELTVLVELRQLELLLLPHVDIVRSVRLAWRAHMVIATPLTRSDEWQRR
jgi:hypothetical protein